MVIARDWGMRGMGSQRLMKQSGGEDGKLLTVDSGNGCTTLRWKLKNG